MTRTRLFLVYSGHSSSTYDVAAYLHQAFVKMGITVRPYPLHTEIRFNELALRSFYKETGKDKDPDANDYLYLASRSMVSELLIFDPDIVFVVTGTAVPAIVWDMVCDIRRRVRKRWLQAIYLTESPYMPNDELNLAVNYADVAFTNEKTFVDVLRSARVPAFYLPHAYAPDVHYPAPSGEDFKWDVYLCGTGFKERTEFLESVDWGGIRFALRGVWPDIPGTALDVFYKDGIIPNAAVADEYRHSKIVLNIHRWNGLVITASMISPDGARLDRREPCHVTDAYSTNARVIEAAACGCVVATDRRREIEDILGDSVLYFDTADSLEQGIRAILADDDRRRRMAMVARERVSGRTYDNNAAYIIDILGGL